LSERTVAAIATPLGEGGISVIRISGDKAIECAERCFTSFSGVKLCELSGYQAAYGKFHNGEETLDDGIALIFKAPKSYTGEDVVELSVHGGRIVTKAVLRAVLAAGAEAAAAGEFTKRAFLNGKMDLSRAESVMGLISAENETAYRISRSAKDGRIRKEIDKITEALTAMAASIAVYSDYPDEEIDGVNEESFLKMLRSSADITEKLLSTYDAGRIIREGIDCAIVGKPNVGKSTLMNLLTGTDRSIVTDIAGTTRDIIEETVTLGDITLRLSDTAGIHATGDVVENVGVERAKRKLSDADLVFAVFDSAQALDNDDLELIESIKDRNAVIILNKSDLPPEIDKNVFSDFEVVEISAKSGEGLDALRLKTEEITKVAGINPDAAVLISEHQRACAERAKNALDEALIAMNTGCTLDAVGVCIDDALAALLELTGKRVTNEVTDEIFRRFCVGK